MDEEREVSTLFSSLSCRKDQFKAKLHFLDQKQRRIQLLDKQKNQRRDITNKFRNLLQHQPINSKESEVSDILGQDLLNPTETTQKTLKIGGAENGEIGDIGDIGEIGQIVENGDPLVYQDFTPKKKSKKKPRNRNNQKNQENENNGENYSKGSSVIGPNLDPQVTLSTIEQMETISLQKQLKKERKLLEQFKDNLMEPEKLIEIPEDLEENWICVPIPIGKRCLLISSNGETVSRLRNGSKVDSFQSYLPGGGGKKFSNKDCCFLDCILYEPTLTYYVIDLMCWRGNLYYDCDTEFRFFWVYSKLSEDYDFNQISSQNQMKITPLPRYPCDFSSLKKGSTSNYEFKLDGYYLYHKLAHYTFGETPLVCSVSIDMLQSLLNGAGRECS